MEKLKIKIGENYHTYSYKIEDEELIFRDSNGCDYFVDLNSYKHDLDNLIKESKVTLKQIISKYNMSRATLYKNNKNNIETIIKLHLICLDIIKYNKIKTLEIAVLDYLLKKEVITISDYAKKANISREFIHQILNNPDKKINSENVDKLRNTNDLIKNNLINQMNDDNQDLSNLDNLEFFKLVFE